jgi:hypothetical protein
MLYDVISIYNFIKKKKKKKKNLGEKLQEIFPSLGMLDIACVFT